jgi:hypothetical protein
MSHAKNVMTSSGKKSAAKSTKQLPYPEALAIIIPCRLAKGPDRITPIYLVKENELGGPERGRWECRNCGELFHTRKAWAKHSGMVSNIMGNCPGGGSR